MLKILEFVEAGEYETAWSLAVATGREESLYNIVCQMAESVSKRERKFPCSVSFFPKYSVYELDKQHSIAKFHEENNENQIYNLLKQSGNFENEFDLMMPKFVKNQVQLDKWM